MKNISLAILHKYHQYATKLHHLINKYHYITKISMLLNILLIVK